jgi:hypothetical protein
MRILIVAPDGDLQNLAELIEAVGENIATPLRGTVTARELLQRLRSEQFDAVHFAGHGESMELGLSDGPLSIELLSSAIQEGTHPRLMFFNACASLPAAASLHGYGVGYTIGWRQDEVPDNAASSFAVTFYNSLRLNGGNVRRAFDSAIDMMRRHFPETEEPIIINGRMAALLAEVVELRASVKNRNSQALNTGHIISIVALIVSLVAFFLR